MIFGKTHADRTAENQKKWMKKVHGKKYRVKKFAFFPVRLNSGSYAWLQFVYAEGEFYMHKIFGIQRTRRAARNGSIYYYTTIEGDE